MERFARLSTLLSMAIEGKVSCKALDLVLSNTITKQSFVVISIDDDFRIDHQDDKTRSRNEARALYSLCDSVKDKGTLDEYADCAETLSLVIREAADEMAFQATLRKNVAKLWENYTCADDARETSQPVAKEHWLDPKDTFKRYNVQIFHNRSASQIHLIQGFISERECQAMEKVAKPKLCRADVANGKVKRDDLRRAYQAGITVPWKKEKDGNVIAKLSRRVFDYANHVLDLGIEAEGQEKLISIQYFAREGKNASDADQYLPHCDGLCLGNDPHRPGQRVATMIMYCTVPTRGGATVFRNSGVHVKPVKGNAIFFSYVNPKTMITDSGYTYHTGCPVLEGEKKIVTQWIRHGVDAENPWYSMGI